MSTYSIIRRDEVVGTLHTEGERYTLTTEHVGVRRAVEAVLKVPSARMVGRIEGTTIYDGFEEFAVGEPGHLDAAILGGALVRFGYMGRRDG